MKRYKATTDIIGLGGMLVFGAVGCTCIASFVTPHNWFFWLLFGFSATVALGCGVVGLIGVARRG